MSNAEFLDVLKRHPLRIIAGALMVLSGVGVYFVGGYIETAEQTLQQKTQEGDRLAANVKFGGQLPEQLAAMTAAGNVIQGRAVQGGQLANNLQYFYRLETESGVELLDVRQTTASGSSRTGGKAVGFSLTVKANYPTLLGWLRRLEKGPHYCRITSASLGLAELDRSTPLILNLSLELLGQP
jgi:hypothetical protein